MSIKFWIGSIAVLKKVRYALCPMPYALCPMPYALCPVLPHLSEKGYRLVDSANCAKDLLRTAHTGIEIPNSEPCPREEFTVNVPPCFSTTIWWAIDNPNPVP